MKVYSILAHPNKPSLNSTLFDLANDHFTQQGHTVKVLDLFPSADKLIDSAKIIYHSDAVRDKKHTSTYYHNYVLEQKSGDFAKDEIKKLKEADLLYIQTPILVWSLPAMLKLYIENVFLFNELFSLIDPWSDDGFYIDRYMTDKKVLFSFTTGSGQAMTKSVMGSTTALIQPVKSMFEFVGYKWIDPHITWGTTRTRDIDELYILEFNNFLSKLKL